MHGRIFAWSVLLVPVILGNGAMATDATRLLKALPATIESWEAVVPDRAYDSSSLFEYIDGGAELFRSYGLGGTATRAYRRPEQPDIVVDVFDMQTSQDAFGVFSHSREDIDSTYGQGCQNTPGLLLFWQDRFYVSILANPETPQSKKVVQSLARTLESAIGKTGALPPILALLPQRSLVAESVRYFCHHAWQNSHYYFSDKNLLHIDRSTGAVLARYRDDGGTSILLLVTYAGNADAQRAREGYVKEYAPELRANKAVRVEDGTWTACAVSGKTLSAVLCAPTEEQAITLSESGVGAAKGDR